MPLSYIEWNKRLFHHFFNETVAYREVIIYVDENIINQIGKPDGDINDYLNAVKSWNSYTNYRSLCQKAYSAYSEWDSRRENYSEPLYFAYLVFFIYAGTIEDQDGRSYYRRLNVLLDEQVRDLGSPPSFDRMELLWDDLDYYTSKIKKGEIGVFSKVETQFRHVGNPLSQSLITQEDRSKLPKIFYSAGMSPEEPPSEEELRDVLVNYDGDGGLSRRIKNLLRKITNNHTAISDSEKAAYILMMRLIFSELSSWDGNPPQELEGHSISRAFRCLRKGLLSYSTGLRIKLQGSNYLSFSDIDNLSLIISGNRYSLLCEDSLSSIGWSRRIKWYKDGECKEMNTLEIPLLWYNGGLIADGQGQFKANIKKGTIHLFRSGSIFGLEEDWIEVSRLERNCRMLIACHEDNANIVERWGKTEANCGHFEKINVLPSLHGWVFYKIENVIKGSEQIADLSLPNHEFATSRLEGGLKLKSYNKGIKKYLEAGLPTLVLEGGRGDEEAILWVEGNQRCLSRVAGEGQRWELPHNIPIELSLRVDIGRYDTEGRFRKAAYSHTLKIKKVKINNKIEKLWRNRAGEVVNEEQSGQEPKINGYQIQQSFL